MENRTSPEEVVSRNVRRRRSERSWTLQEMSERLDAIGHPLSLKVLSRIENGDRGLGIDDLVAFSEVFDVDVADLLAERPWGGIVNRLREARREQDRAREKVREWQALEHWHRTEAAGLVEDLLREMGDQGLSVDDVAGAFPQESIQAWLRDELGGDDGER